MQTADPIALCEVEVWAVPDYWIGVNELDSEVGVFQHVDGSSMQQEFWHPGKPVEAFVMNCVAEVTKNYTTLWSDFNCEREIMAICQRTVLTTT
uniref:Tetranectin-like protein-like n=1 Tax=Saccoglossus kowalevskii TaxID=10224 RepID=A0ABM0MVI5_SACKO|nr:PREDICTED: tetranectin-like protein-like [Saccoglossus kowalevskii]